MNVFIAGGFGFLGGRIAQYLKYKGYSVILGSSKQRASPDWLPEAKVVLMDWFSDESLEKCCQGVDFIVHAAGVNAKECNEDPVFALEFNGVATTRLVQIAVKSQIKKFIYFSTAHVYSAELRGRINEYSPVSNLNPYATSHYAGERSVLAAASNNKIDGIVIRLSNAYGVPTEKNINCWQLLINDICRQVVENGEIVLKTSGAQERDFIPITQVCITTENILAFESKKEKPSLINLGSYTTHTVLDIAKLVQKRSEIVLNIKPKIKITEKNDVLEIKKNLRYESLRYESLTLGEKKKNIESIQESEIDEILIFCKKNFT